MRENVGSYEHHLIYNLLISLSNGTGILLLCEAAVKPFNELENALYDADQECKKHNTL